MLGWVLFRADSVTHAWEYWRAMFGLQPLDGPAHPWQMYGTNSALLALAVGFALAILPAFQSTAAQGNDAPAGKGLMHTYAKPVALALGFALCVLSLASNTYNPFIYFRF
jgi:alginate O-acetyltransferase complex protein AlgI